MNAFCPKCGGALEKRYVNAEMSNRQVCQDCGSILYRNSKPCLGVVALKGDRVLLVKRAIEPFKGCWDIPGGFLEEGEHPAHGAVRELQEETGLIIDPVEVLGIYMDVYGAEEESTLNICYVARVIGGEPRMGSDAIDMNWFPILSLPRDSAFACTKEALDLLKQKLVSFSSR